MTARLGAIETGGTKIVCSLSDGRAIVADTEFPTGVDPREALHRAAGFFGGHGGVDALGVASFGPCDPDPSSPHYGWLGSTPKPGWADTDVLGLLRGFGLTVPMAFDTDVNVAAYGEWRAAGADNGESLLYVTVGTGIGGGYVEDGRPRHGRSHPEMGHQFILGAPPDGICPYHGNCWEGIAAGPAIEAREGRPGPAIAADDPAWETEAGYLATGLANLALVLAPAAIVLGGGVGSLPQVHELVRHRLRERLAGYVPMPALRAPALGNRSAVYGAFAMAARAHALHRG